MYIDTHTHSRHMGLLIMGSSGFAYWSFRRLRDFAYWTVHSNANRYWTKAVGPTTGKVVQRCT